MEPSLDAIRFLASSRNRVRVLEALADGEATRRELQEAVDGTRSTVARVLDDSQSRGWVDSEGSRHWLTPRGEAMVEDFLAYLETVEGHLHVGELVDHFPPPLFSLDFRHLQDAEIVRQTAENPAAPHTLLHDCVHEASGYRGLNSTAFPRYAKVLIERVEAGQLDFEQVFEGAFVETIRDDRDRTAAWESVVDRVWEYDGVVPINLQIFDGTVLVWLGESRDVVAGVLVSENPAVLAWAESLYDEYRAESERLDEL